jgi:colicin import membrane protein
LSLPASALLHGGLLAWAIIGFQETKPFKPIEPEPVEVAIITEDGLTRLRQGDRNAKNLEAAPAKAAPPSQAVKETPKAKPPEPTPPPPPPPEPAKIEPPPPPPPKAAEAPPPPPPPPKPPEPAKDEIAELALKAEAEAKAEAQRKADAERKAAEERKRLDDLKKRQEAEKKKRDDLKKKQDELKRLAEAKRRAEEAKKKPSDDFFDDMQKALKDNDPRKRAPQPSGAQVAQASNVKGPLAGAPEGRDTRLTTSEANLLGSMMKRQVSRCWNISSGAEGVDRIKIEIEVKLGPDGRIQGQPKVVSRGTGPLYSDMADSAMRALIQCQAYDLPKHLYKGGWDHMIVDFDPSRMF